MICGCCNKVKGVQAYRNSSVEGGCIPASLPVNSPTCFPFTTLGWIVRAAERPLDTLNTTGPQALSPVWPCRPPTIHCHITKFAVNSNFLNSCRYLLLLQGVILIALLVYVNISSILYDLKIHLQYFAEQTFWFLHKTQQLFDYSRPTWTVCVRLASLGLSSLTNAYFAAHLHVLTWPVSHSSHLTHTLLWQHALLQVVHHQALWTPTTWSNKYWG